MRGRRSCPLTLAGDDVAILQMIARSRSRPWFQVQHARILLAAAAGQRIQTLASQMQCHRATVWRVCRGYQQHGLDIVLCEAERPGRPQQLSPPPAPLRSSSWPAWNRSPKGCISPIGPPPTWPVKRPATASSRRSARARSGRFSTMSTCNRIVRATGRLLASTPSSRHGPSTSCGATEMLEIWPARAVGRLRRRDAQLADSGCHPLRRAIPGSIEQQESEYTRHGTVNLLMFLIVHSGRMELAVEPRKDAKHYSRGAASVPPPASPAARGVSRSGRRPEPHGR